MMKKAMAMALLSLACATASASMKTGQYQPDSIALNSNQIKTVNFRDTGFRSAVDNPLHSYQNLVYKRRLDSLEQSVPLSYNEHVQNYIDIYVYKRKAQIGKVLGLSKYYFPIFEKSLREVGVPVELKYVTIIESALNPHAVSRSGAVGPWQFMYTTAKGYGLLMDSYVDERKDPVQASHAAAVYLKDAYNRIGDWLLAIAAFNCGTGAVTRAIARSGGEADFWKVRPFLPRETQNYVPAFIATVYAMNYYEKHEIIPQEAAFNIFTEVIDVNRMVSFSSIAQAAEIDVNELRILNPSYKKQVVNGTPASPKQLVIPAISKQLYASLYDVLNSEVHEQPQVIAASNRVSDPSPITIPETHRVKEGQTLDMVANQYGLEVQDLKVYNNLKNLEVVPGQVVRLKYERTIPKSKKVSPSYVTYIVKVGDTLSEIAGKFSGTSVSRIKALNGLKKNTVQPGMRLKINKG
ncbi:transglycosylase SLT domain-containing protein [Flavihumibacter sp. R14]|nr:transglycosylase SLT domain-containing protein [Flavihumibacter soli]